MCQSCEITREQNKILNLFSPTIASPPLFSSGEWDNMIIYTRLLLVYTLFHSHLNTAYNLWNHRSFVALYLFCSSFP